MSLLSPPIISPTVLSPVILSLLILVATLAGLLPRLLGRFMPSQTLPLLRGLSLGAILVLVAGHLVPEAWLAHGSMLWVAVAGWLWALALIERLGGHRHDHGQEASWAKKIAGESLWIALYVHAMADGAAFAAVAHNSFVSGGLAIMLLHRVAISLTVVNQRSSTQQWLRLLLLAAITIATANGLLFAVDAQHSLFWSSLLIATLTHLGNHTYVVHRSRDATVGRIEKIGLLVAVVATLPLIAWPPGQGLLASVLALGAYLALIAAGRYRQRQHP